jgi:hypothetical protein
MDSMTSVETELDSYFTWLAQFESGIPSAQHVVSCWYRSPMLQAYMRYSWFKPSTPGEPALCLANITVADDARSRGYFARLVQRFLDGSDGLKARVLYVENIASPRFELWLLRAGFRRCEQGACEFSAYYLVR